MSVNRVICGSFPFRERMAETALVKGEGIYIFDQDGRKYLDLCSGYSNEKKKKHIEKQLE